VGNGIAPPCARAAENVVMMNEPTISTTNPTRAVKNKESGKKYVDNHKPYCKPKKNRTNGSARLKR
jgi:exonuclease III